MRSAGSSEPSVSSTEFALAPDPDAAADLDLAARDQLRGADVDVIARARTPGLHREAGFVGAKFELQSGFREPRVEGGVSAADLFLERDLPAVHDRKRCGGEQHIGLLCRDPGRERGLRIEGPEPSSIRVSDLTTSVDERCSIVTSAPYS